MSLFKYKNPETGEWQSASVIRGAPGKTAYEYAQDAGYTGTETEFSENLAAEIPTKTSQLTNDSGFITGYIETDPTVPAWAKEPTKPTYTASEVGALPVETIIPTAVSQLQNDVGYLTEHQDISGKLDANKLPEAVETALAKAKESGVFDGKDGHSPSIMVAKNEITGDVVISVEKNGAYQSVVIPKCADGEPGEDGFSPNATVEQTENGAVITITDRSGTTTATVANGKDGADGAPGEKGDKGDTGATGPQGPKGDKGDDGYTPVRGTDYWTDADQAAIDADVSKKVAAALADRTQLTPEFANSIEECTDTSKLYVLPDGFIYAYIGVTTVKKFTNQLDEAGYESGYRLSSSGAASKETGSYLTGYIPAKAGSVIRLKNVTFQTGVTTGLTSSNQRLAYYDADKKFLSLVNANDIANTNYGYNATVDNSGVITQFTLSSSKTNTEYIRLNCHYIGADSIITVNEEMVEGTETTYQWANTGRAFVPADYEERIIDLETQAVALETKVDAIAVGENGVPLYISEEAERVANLVQGKRTVGSLTFTAMSDPHVAVGTTANWLAPNETSVRDAGFALSELRKHLTLDFTAMLGDYTYGSASYTVERLKKDIQYFKKCMSDGSNGIPSLWLTGNHDINYGADSDRRMTDDELYAYITGNNVGTVQDVENVGRNYGYIDFENQRIRCIYLNSVDALDYPDNSGAADDALEITAVQTQWIADVGLDLSKKQSPEDWQIVILSHQPLNLYSHVMAVLEAHKNGASGSVDVTTNGVTATVNYDFTAAARGEVIANIHGHNHNFTAKKIGTDGWLWRICVPNMDVTRNNEAATSGDTSWAELFGEFDEAGEPVYYPKTQGTATSTSFCVMTIDRKNRKIYAICYGAGIDREIDY